MINKTFALVRRALQADTRDFRPHLFRCALAFTVLFTLATIQMNSFSRTAPGKDLFTWVLYINYWFITAAGATFFATAITEEKEERTLGLMKMAGVGGAAILAGKWIPRLIGALLLILIQIPFTVLAITLGGVMWSQIGAAYIALLAHLFLVGNIGLLASVLRPTMSSASGLCVLILFLFHLLPMFARSALQAMITPTGVTTQLLLSMIYLCDTADQMCAMWQFPEIMGTGFNSLLLSFQVISNLIAGGILLLLSWLFFDICTRNDIEPGEATWLNKSRHLVSFGNARRSWDAALIWKDFHYLVGGLFVLLIKCIAYAVAVFVMVMFVEDWNWRHIDFDDVGAVCFGLGLFMLIVKLAVIVTRVYREEMTQNTWSLLSMLPTSLAAIAYAKLLGGLIGLLPVLGCLLVSFLMVPDDWMDVIEDILTEADAFLIVSYFTLQAILGLHLGAYLSVIARWAVWPLSKFLATFTIVMWNVMVISCLNGMGGRSEEGIFFILCCISGVVILVLHYILSQRLVAMSSE